MATLSRSVFAVALIFLAAATGSVRGVRLPTSAPLVGRGATAGSQADRGPQPPDRTSLVTAFGAVDKLFTDFATENHVPGAAWGIVIGDELLHVRTIGFRELGSKSPVGRDSVFRIASMTKSFTAMSILKLRDEGKLSLDDPAERYVPELKTLAYPTGDSPRITIRHLLSHAAGFPEDNPWGDQQLADSEEQLSQMLRAGIPFSNAPGIAYEYSNYGFAILGRIVSNVSKTKYGGYVAANILKPLGMTSTTLEPDQVPSHALAHGYRWEDAQWKEEPLLSNGSFGSMGGMLTSVDDLSRYVAAFLAAWPPHDGPEAGPIKRSSLREMQQVWRPASASVTHDAAGAIQLNAGGYGFGLRVSQTCAFRHVVAHSGGLPGFGSVMTWLPDYGIGIVAFGNLTYTSWGRVTPAALDALANARAIHPRSPRASPALTDARNAVSRLIVRWDDAAADAIAAGNLYLDRSKPRRKAEIDVLRAAVGACTPGGGFDSVENALRGQWTMNCERGKLQVAITLAPTMPPRVQYLNVRAAPDTPPRSDTCR
jgi:CubicO group peptidase (beta-lactamase class C family)